MIVASSTRGHLPQVVMGYDWSVMPRLWLAGVKRTKATSRRKKETSERYSTIIPRIRYRVESSHENMKNLTQFIPPKTKALAKTAKKRCDIRKYLFSSIFMPHSHGQDLHYDQTMHRVQCKCFRTGAGVHNTALFSVGSYEFLVL